MKTKMTEIEKILERCELLLKDHEPKGWPAIKMRDITSLCTAVKGAIPALDLLEARLDQGCAISKVDGRWCLYAGEEIVCSGKTIREMMVNLIFSDC